MKTHFEYRTTKATAAQFASEELAKDWWSKLKNRAYAEALKLVKVTTIVREEPVP